MTTRPRISFVTDNPGSWSIPGTQRLIAALVKEGYQATLVHSVAEAPDAEIAVYLSCLRLVHASERARFKHNLVVHASALPHGRGWSPLSWEVIGNATEVTVTLFEAVDAADAGPVYLRKVIPLQGHELIDDLRALLDRATDDLVMEFVHSWPNIQATAQTGEPSSFPPRRPADSELDPDKTLRESFNLLRVVDNERYPAFFTHAGHVYELRITRRR